MKVVVYDVDSEQHIADLSRHDLLGEVEVTLADIISAGQTLTKSLKIPGKCPTSAPNRELTLYSVCMCTCDEADTGKSR